MENKNTYEYILNQLMVGGGMDIVSYRKAIDTNGDCFIGVVEKQTINGCECYLSHIYDYSSYDGKWFGSPIEQYGFPRPIIIKTELKDAIDLVNQRLGHLNNVAFVE